MVNTTRIETQRAERLLKALCNHFSRKTQAHYEANQGYIEFGDGKCELTSSADGLTLQVTAESADSLARLQRVVIDHLLRFSPEEQLKVKWDN